MQTLNYSQFKITLPDGNNLDFAKKVSNENTSSKTVLDIACNDGSQLNAFSNYGWKTYGVDPAENLLEESSKVHNITHGFWPCDTHLKKYDVIVAQNVLAHTPNPYEFLLACSDNITNTGKIYIQIRDMEPPSAPIGLTTSTEPGSIILKWQPNSETDLKGYFIQRSLNDDNNSDNHFVNMNTIPIDSSQFVQKLSKNVRNFN